MTGREGADMDPVVALYDAHPSPGYPDRLEAADRRMRLRLHACGVGEEDYVGKRVLDAGCGTGEYALWFAARGAHVTGIDLSPGAPDEARAFAERHEIDGVRFERCSVLDTGMEASGYDLVYCTGVLHHTGAPYQGFRELCRLLRPRGKILVSLYNRAGFLSREIRWRLVRWIADDDPDERVRWGRRLFPRTADRLHDETLGDPDSRLYDYFGVERQSQHTVGELLRWFDREGLAYRGGFPPAILSDYPPLFSHPAYDRLEPEHRGPIRRALGRPGRDEMRRARPGPASRIAVQLLWLVSGVGIFSVCGKEGAPA